MASIAPDLMVIKEFSAASTDMLSGTDLDQPESNGRAIAFLGSSVSTATLEIAMPGHSPGNTNYVLKRTDGIPLLNSDPGYSIPIAKGKRPILILGGTTGTCVLIVLVWW